jgi:hypothetical protein
MNDELRVGQTYTLNEIAHAVGGSAMLTSEDRIVTDDLAWKRMTIGRLKLWIEASLETGEVDADTEVWADSDPESNDLHPLRASVALGRVHEETPYHHEWEDEDESGRGLPAKAVLIGVGY